MNEDQELYFDAISGMFLTAIGMHGISTNFICNKIIRMQTIAIAKKGTPQQI